MTDRKKDADILTEKVDELIKQRDIALRDITQKISNLMIERDKISEPYQEQIEELKNEYLNKYLKDSKGNPIKVEDVIINNNTGQKYRVVDRYQQILLGYLGNPRVNVRKIKKDGNETGAIITIFPDDLKNYTKIE